MPFPKRAKQEPLSHRHRSLSTYRFVPTTNHQQQPTTNHNHNQQPTTNYQQPTTNHQLQPTTTTTTATTTTTTNNNNNRQPTTDNQQQPTTLTTTTNPRRTTAISTQPQQSGLPQSHQPDSDDAAGTCPGMFRRPRVVAASRALQLHNPAPWTYARIMLG